MEQKYGKATVERIFLRLTTTRDRERISSFIGFTMNTLTNLIFAYQLVMRRSFSKYLLITGGAFLTLFGIYFIR